MMSKLEKGITRHYVKNDLGKISNVGVYKITGVDSSMPDNELM